MNPPPEAGAAPGPDLEKEFVRQAPLQLVFNITVKLKRKRSRQSLLVMAKHMPVPDANERLSRAYGLILRAAARVDSDGEQGEGAGAPSDGSGDQGNV